MNNVEKILEDINTRPLVNIEDVESVYLCSTQRDEKLNYGYCEDYAVFIAWDENGYYLANEHIEIVKTLPNLKLVVGEYYDDEY